MTGNIIFDPLLPWSVVYIILGLSALAIALAIWRGLSGWWLRALGAAALIAALVNPAYQEENRTALTDIVLMIVDESASQRISDRPSQTAEAVTELTNELRAMPDTELRTVTLGDGEGDEGTLLATALAEALAEEPAGRIAGAILVTDGQLHDLQVMPKMPAPLHVLLSGHEDDWDRRLIVKNAPAFAILDEEVQLTLRIEDQGRVPEDVAPTAELAIAIDGGEPITFTIPVGQDIELPITLPHGGMNVLQFSIPTAESELTDRNNSAVVQMNGVRDRLRVLLVSGEPHAGERTWRNLLKSDSSVDLVHFTILRPPNKQDDVPVDELSLIAFPTRELFVEKINEFDLIIFDRYRRRGILQLSYIDNIRAYIEQGGAVLVAGGPDYGSADSLFRSPLGDVLPAAPTARVIEQPFRPVVSETGQRHPVTEDLEGAADGEEGQPSWGRWFRLAEVVLTGEGQVLMEGPDAKPLLILNRVEEGRVALLASDQAWLWSRGYEGGGPQLELLRRLAHWMMKEPDLEEEALSTTAEGQTMSITRRTMGEGPRQVEITSPDGTVTTLPMDEAKPGRFTTVYEAPEMGLYRLKEGDLETVIALGPAAPREFEQTIATGEHLVSAVEATRGGVLKIEEGVPDIRRVAEGRNAAGRGWIGITPRGAYLTADVEVNPLLPAWLFLLLAAMFTLGAWILEGRR